MLTLGPLKILSNLPTESYQITEVDRAKQRCRRTAAPLVAGGQFCHREINDGTWSSFNEITLVVESLLCNTYDDVLKLHD